MEHGEMRDARCGFSSRRDGGLWPVVEHAPAGDTTGILGKEIYQRIYHTIKSAVTLCVVALNRQIAMGRG